MRVQVRFLGVFRQLAACDERGIEEKEIELPPGAKVKDLLEVLGRELPPPFSSLFLEKIDDSLLGHLVLVNRRPLREVGGEPAELHDGDVVSLVPPMAGGTSCRAGWVFVLWNRSTIELMRWGSGCRRGRGTQGRNGAHGVSQRVLAREVAPAGSGDTEALSNPFRPGPDDVRG